MNHAKISLIFACYNVSQYLDKLFKLLVTQPYQNIEIIFVEDCSTDDTKAKLLAFSDSRVKLLCNEKNIGATESAIEVFRLQQENIFGFLIPMIYLMNRYLLK
ncbi:glycosyltransferase [Actinobacillus arthritidis]|nr:glycosyltransferase [Actinobacillus arthritidis]WGE89329.1 glycosyltransferase [Actinobacillus arthritidis]